MEMDAACGDRSRHQQHDGWLMIGVPTFSTKKSVASLCRVSPSSPFAEHIEGVPIDFQNSRVTSAALRNLDRCLRVFPTDCLLVDGRWQRWGSYLGIRTTVWFYYYHVDAPVPGSTPKLLPILPGQVLGSQRPSNLPLRFAPGGITRHCPVPENVPGGDIEFDFVRMYYTHNNLAILIQRRALQVNPSHYSTSTRQAMPLVCTPKLRLSCRSRKVS
ncbi:hypothetical protein LX36DRAFT_328187 [Colletotrichum falcatum]|nr:hypothetical protein LX36DRAFT_328187 [Colletotrichum falcatum]